MIAEPTQHALYSCSRQTGRYDDLASPASSPAATEGRSSQVSSGPSNWHMELLAMIVLRSRREHIRNRSADRPAKHA